MNSLKKHWQLTLFIIAVLSLSGYFFYQSQQEPDLNITGAEVKTPETPTAKAPVGDTSQGGHWHGDEWHAEPHDTHKTPSPVVSAPQPPAQTAVGGGYWSNGVYHRPAGYVPPYPRGQTSSNPYFKDGVPEHLKCPEKWIGAYRWAISDWAVAIEKVRQIGFKVMEQYNPNRPIHEVWPRFIEAELFYQANADIPPLDPERYPPGSFDEFAAAPEVATSVDRIDWLIQNALDYPEVIKLMIEDGTTCNNAWRMELGFDKPGWNAVTLVDGRIFYERSDHRYEFTFTDGNQTFTLRSSHSGGADAPLVRINLNETSDEELEALGTDYSIIPYRQGDK